MLKRFFAVALIGLLVMDASGCNSSWRKKFVRKRKKETAGPQAILALQPDAKAVFPPADRYRQHFAFWKSWHGDLLSSLGQIHKRDLRTMDGVIGELRAMQSDLTGPPADRLKEILVELSEMQDQWERAPGNAPIPAAHRTRLQQLQREINKKFHYSNVKELIVK